MLCPETLDLGSNVCGQGTRRDEIGEVGRLTNKPMRPESSKTTKIEVQHNLLASTAVTAVATLPSVAETWSPPRP
jgi:hypothetical protein